MRIKFSSVTYSAVQIGFDKKKEKNTSCSLKGHFKKANVEPLKKLVEFRDFDKEVKLGDKISISDVFTEGDFVDVIGMSKGRGFQGPVKRHGFSGLEVNLTVSMIERGLQDQLVLLLSHLEFSKV